MPVYDTDLAPQDARQILGALLQRCEPIGRELGSEAVAWSLTGIERVLAEDAAPLRLSECLILAGVITHLLETAIHHADVISSVPKAWVDARRDALAFIERCAWAAAAPPPETSDPRVDRALRYLRDRFRQSDLSMDDVARHVGLSRRYLGRMLAQHTARSFAAHLHEMRIRESRRLLVVSPLSVKEIATAVGYTNAAEFCRQFKRLSDTTPGGFRQTARSVNRRHRAPRTSRTPSTSRTL